MKKGYDLQVISLWYPWGDSNSHRPIMRLLIRSQCQYRGKHCRVLYPPFPGSFLSGNFLGSRYLSLQSFVQLFEHRFSPPLTRW